MTLQSLPNTHEHLMNCQKVSSASQSLQRYALSEQTGFTSPAVPLEFRSDYFMLSLACTHYTPSWAPWTAVPYQMDSHGSDAL